MRALGPFQQADKPNDNSRVYPRLVWEEVLESNGRFMSRVRNREVFGEMEHPESGVTDLKRVSHIIDNVEIGKDGLIMGEATILNIPETLRLKELFALGAKVAVSSRGRGETMTRSDGLEEVQSGYVLDTFDFVCTPSVRIARTQLATPGVEYPSAVKSVAEVAKGKNVHETIERVREVLLCDWADAVSLAEAYAVVRTLLLEGLSKSLVDEVARLRTLLEARLLGTTSRSRTVHNIVTETFKKTGPSETKDALVDVYAQKEASMPQVSEARQVFANSLVERYLALKSKAEEAEQRYKALTRICEALVKRCRATEMLAEALLSEARKKRKKASSEEKKQGAYKKITEELLARYHKDSAAFFAEGFTVGHPGKARFRKVLRECHNAMQAARLAKELLEDITKKNVCESLKLIESRAKHPSRVTRMGLNEDIMAARRLEEVADRSYVPRELNLVEAIVQWEHR